MDGDIIKVIESLAGGLLSGGAATLATALATWKEIKAKIKTLEDKVGSSEEPKTGIHQQIWENRELYRRLRNEIDGWEHDPPTWALRVLRARASSSPDLDGVLLLERRVKSLQDRVSALEEEAQERPVHGSYLKHDDYEQDSRARAEKIAELEHEIQACSNMLKGILAALYKDAGPPMS